MRWNFVTKNILKYLPRKSKILVVSPSSLEVNFFFEKNYYDVTFGAYSKNDLNSLSLNSKFGDFIKIDARDIKFKDKYFDYTFANKSTIDNSYFFNPIQKTAEIIYPSIEEWFKEIKVKSDK